MPMSKDEIISFLTEAKGFFDMLRRGYFHGRAKLLLPGTAVGRTQGISLGFAGIGIIRCLQAAARIPAAEALAAIDDKALSELLATTVRELEVALIAITLENRGDQIGMDIADVPPHRITRDQSNKAIKDAEELLAKAKAKEVPAAAVDAVARWYSADDVTVMLYKHCYSVSSLERMAERIPAKAEKAAYWRGVLTSAVKPGVIKLAGCSSTLFPTEVCFAAGAAADTTALPRIDTAARAAFFAWVKDPELSIGAAGASAAAADSSVAAGAAPAEASGGSSAAAAASMGMGGSPQ